MDIKQLYKKYSLNTYTRLGPVFLKGKGSFLWDQNRRRYLDLFPGWGVSILGHSHPRLAKIIARQAKCLIHLPNNLFSVEQALLAKKIVDKSFPAKVFFANSGAEAVEGAVKLSRLFGKGSRYEVITMKNSFHGRTFGALSATGQKKYKEVFKPLVPGFKEARFNDFCDFKRKVTAKTAAVMLELIQGEGGVNVADKDYVQKLYAYCKAKNILLIIDEVQTGMARTGKLFCYQNYGIMPDIMILSKGLGAGVPISAIVVSNRISGLIKPGMHASTFGGSPLICRVCREVFDIIEMDGIILKTVKSGKYLNERLQALKSKFSFIKQIRIKGLMAGIELDIESLPVFKKCLEKKLIVNSTHGNVIRIMPALNIEQNNLTQGIDIFEEALKRF
ncbi:MAG: aspartate aminotransferase family protein [Candidatus Omnitrophica bacterium]|nr:aspartate aminotransferase family protein [Candidatus Omnitrophota bacterium]MDD5429569.1 aspartate aminotransferase family protein [Candidatus Omnitrophota bacterium]